MHQTMLERHGHDIFGRALEVLIDVFAAARDIILHLLKRGPVGGCILRQI
jgi:hypothetical protein